MRRQMLGDQTVAGSRPGSSSGGGGAMTGPRRNQTLRKKKSGVIRGAGGGLWGADGRPESQARRSANAHGGFLGAGRRFGGRVLSGTWCGSAAEPRAEIEAVEGLQGESAARF